MQHIEEFVSGWHAIELARIKLQEPTFENVVFRFVEISRNMPKNSKVIDYQRAMDTFRTRYYNEFMYKCTVRTDACQKFVDLLADFSDKQKPPKKEYASLFETLCGYYTGSVGGTKHGIPLLSLPETSLRDSPAFYMDWCYDQVHAVRKELGIHSDRCVFTNARGVRETLVGSRFCPAACLPMNANSELKSEVVAQWLDKTKAFMVPEPTAAIRHYLTEVFQVCTGLVSDPETTLKSLQVSLQEHSGSIVEDNHRLKKENMVLSHKLSDLEVVQRHIVEDNEESQISLRAIHEEMSNLGRKFRQCETAFYELRSHHCDKIQEISSLKHQLEESIHNQWSYYNKLKQHGLIR